jgi:methylmalonyl-CoA carboxyltransferase large subunit
MSKVTLKGLSEELDALRAHLLALTEKIHELEGAANAAPSHSVEVEAEERVAAPPEPPPVGEEITEEILLALSAAVAAYLGKRVPIRTVRLLGSTQWAQQGRVSIQASHRLDVQHVRVR